MSSFSDYDALRIPLDDAGYDDEGSYYGLGSPVWAVFYSYEGVEHTETVRASNKAEAIEQVKAIDAKRTHTRHEQAKSAS